MLGRLRCSESGGPGLALPGPVAHSRVRCFFFLDNYLIILSVAASSSEKQQEKVVAKHAPASAHTPNHKGAEAGTWTDTDSAREGEGRRNPPRPAPPKRPSPPRGGPASWQLPDPAAGTTPPSPAETRSARHKHARDPAAPGLTRPATGPAPTHPGPTGPGLGPAVPGPHRPVRVRHRCALPAREQADTHTPESWQKR